MILIFLTKWALFTIINFGYNPWVPKFWVPNPHGYPRVIPKKTQNFELYGYPTRKYPWNSDTNPTQPIPKIWFGSGYYPWVPEFWVPNPRHSWQWLCLDLDKDWCLRKVELKIARTHIEQITAKAAAHSGGNVMMTWAQQNFKQITMCLKPPWSTKKVS